MAKTKSPFKGLALAGFCMQISLLFKSAVPIYEGLAVMAEDAADENEKKILTGMSDKIRMGGSFSEAVTEADCFPPYMVEMIVLGERTGTLDVTLEGLSDYYERETRLAESLRRALTYPAMMVFMLLVILFILFTRIMPIFSGVYEQLGAAIPPVAQAAIHIGGILSGVALAVIIILAAAIVIVRLLSSSGRQPAFAAAVMNFISSHSNISRMSALRRFCSTISVTLRCGLRLEEGMNMAEKLADHPQISASIKKTNELVLQGSSFYDAVKDAELFSGFDLQLLRVASRAGQLESILRKLADDYDQKTEDALDSMVARLEPAIVTILAVAVGLVLLSVMLPLAGILSAIG